MSKSLTSIEFSPIGFVEGGRHQATKDNWGTVESIVRVRGELFSVDAVKGLEDLSHIEVLYYFHLHIDEPIETAARHPRNRNDWPKVGIFAQRGRMRMNRIGASICELTKVDGLNIHVRSLDAVDGSPVLDIKPVWAGYLPRTEVKEPKWAREIMAKYW